MQRVNNLEKITQCHGARRPKTIKYGDCLIGEKTLALHTFLTTLRHIDKLHLYRENPHVYPQAVKTLICECNKTFFDRVFFLCLSLSATVQAQYAECREKKERENNP